MNYEMGYLIKEMPIPKIQFVASTLIFLEKRFCF